MTNPPSPDTPTSPELSPLADDTYQPPPPKKSKLPVILAVAAGAVLLVAIAVGGTLYVVGQGGLTKEEAQRECRTAMEREAQRRAGLGGTILVSVNGVELQEVWETDEGWSVNGAASYTLTSALLGATPTTIGLTCEAVAVDDGVRTTVKNRL